MITSYKNKNPFSFIFGSFLKQERKRIGNTSLEFSKKMDIGHSFYRMIESGSANFSISKSYNLVSVLGDRKINFDKLSKFLVGTQIIESFLNKNEKNSNINSLIQLRNVTNDQDYTELVNVTLDLYNLKNEKEIGEYIIDIVTPKILYFLTGDSFKEEEKEKLFSNKIVNQINSTPSLTLEIVLDFIEVLSKHPPLHIMGVAEKWEDDNVNKFTNLKGIYKNPKLIISDENISRFNFKYLYSDAFERLEFIFFSTDKKREELESKFIELVEKYNKKPLTKAQKNKINIVCFKNDSLEQKIQNILKTGYQSEETLEAFWVFNMVSGNQIGFVGVRESNTDKIWNLTYDEVQNKIATLKTFKLDA